MWRNFLSAAIASQLLKPLSVRDPTNLYLLEKCEQLLCRFGAHDLGGAGAFDCQPFSKVEAGVGATG